MTPSPFDPEDEEAVEEMIAQMREHMIADHIVRVTTQAEITQITASSFGLLRATADALNSYAMVLRVVPTMAKEIAGELEKAAEALTSLVPSMPEEEA